MLKEWIRKVESKHSVQNTLFITLITRADDCTIGLQ